MGHYTAHVSIPAADYDAIPEPPRDRFGYCRETRLDAVVAYAVRQWREEEAERYSDARAGTPSLFEIATHKVAYYTAERLQSEERGLTTIIPVCSEDDAVTQKRKVTATLTGEQLRRAQSVGANGLPVRVPHEIADALELNKSHPTMLDAYLVSLPRQLKPKAVATLGTSTTIYEIHAGPGRILDTAPSQAEARAKALEIAEANPAFQRLAVRARIVRIAEDANRGKTTAASNSGSYAPKHNSRPTGQLAVVRPEGTDDDLVVIERPVADSAQVTLELTTQKPKPGAKPEHYLVSFDYHS